MAKPDMAQRALLAQWGLCLDEAKNIYDGKIAEVFEAAKRGLLKRFLSEAGAAANIGGEDEKLYVRCCRVADCYRRAAGICGANKAGVKTAAIGEILSATASTLASRVRLFDEGLAKGSRVYENPVLSEKKSILGAGAACFIHEAELAEEAFRGGFPVPAPGTDAGDSVLKGAAESLRAVYDKSLSLVVSRLGDYESPERAAAAFCLGFLESERGVLSSIEKERIPAMEKELGGSDITPHEKIIILRVLSIFREARGYLEGETGETPWFTRNVQPETDVLPAGARSAGFSRPAGAGFADGERDGTPARSETDTGGEQDGTLARLSAPSETETGGEQEGTPPRLPAPSETEAGGETDKAEWPEILRSFLAETEKSPEECPEAYAGFTGAMELALPVILGRVCWNSHLGRPAFGIRRLCAEAVSLAEGVKNVFAAFGAPGGEDMSGYEGREAEIIAGILETLAIKSESLEESAQSFAGECGEIIAGSASAKRRSFETTGEESKVMLESALSAWAEAFPGPGVPCSDRETARLFQLFISKCEKAESFAAYTEGLRKDGERALAEAEKAAARFRKDFVLYEVSTFEEMINYSVSRLLQSENPAVLEFAGRVSAAAKEIYALLRSRGIELIEPQPHDAFNGKEHEVILAESSPDFAKGEIIKRVSLGYRRNGTVLTRANVIAAR